MSSSSLGNTSLPLYIYTHTHSNFKSPTIINRMPQKMTDLQPTNQYQRPPPLLLGRFELGRLLGHGTFAKVYHARNPSTGDHFAIKVLDKQKILTSNLTSQTKREISILRRVRHPSIVRLHEVMATTSKIYLVMDLVRSGELFAKVSKGRLREQTARAYFQQLVSAVSFCHSRGVFHRDLKPENLLLDHDGQLKVSDFGLGAIAEQSHRQDGLFHTVCGTPAYVAPEVLSRKAYDAAKVDVWSCGVILFVLMAGYLPFHDNNLMAMYRKIYKGEFRSPRWFSPELVKLLARLLDTNPRTRITMAEIMENRWFKKGGFKDVKFYVENDRFYSLDDIDTTPIEVENRIESDARTGLGLPRPASLNAFDIISFSSGCDLSGLFEERGEEKRFLSGEPVERIIERLEEIAKGVRFKVRKKDCRESLEGTREGDKGPLTIAAEIFELTPSIVVVEVKKKAGDREEYEEFCSAELRPGLQTLVLGAATGFAGAANAASDTEEWRGRRE